jgi:iron complex transport system ATP-binding protein
VKGIELSGVGVAYDGRLVVEDVSLDVEAGGWLALIGPNGAGKTTILRSIAGEVAHQGTIAIGGEPLVGWRPAEMARRVAFVRQDAILPAGMTVAQYVLLGRSAYFSFLGREGSRDRGLVAQTLEKLALDGLAERALESLSGGERQRAAIARAVVQEAPVLLVDEPTSALDLGRQQEVLDLIDGLRRDRGLTVIAAMHDLTLAGQYAQIMALLVEGRLVRLGRPTEVLTEELIASRYRARVRIARVGGAERAVVADRSLGPLGWPLSERGLSAPTGGDR